MLDYHLAVVYKVETKRLNEQVKRNLQRFPESFRFQLTTSEWEGLQSQFATAAFDSALQSQNATAKRRTLPYVFTEQGVSMLSAVLNSNHAIQISIQIMQAFVHMRRFMTHHASIFQRLDGLEIKQLKTDEKLDQIFKALEAGHPQPQKGIFFEDQIFDAYVLISGIIKKAKSDIILIDNYIDETVLTLFAKCSTEVKVTIYTQILSSGKRQNNNLLQLDLYKYHKQYRPVEIINLTVSHDRFLIIDEMEMYHLGASLKDLGKKWFAFSRMDSLCNDVLAKLKSSE
jgi:hypothetical protein